MTTAEKQVTGTVLEVTRQDGEGKNGAWTKWGFNVQHSDTGEKHKYGWFDDAGANVKSGQTYTFSYTTSPNGQSPEHPYRNIQSLIDAPPQSASQSQPATSQEADNQFTGKPEPGQERREPAPRPKDAIQERIEIGMAFNAAYTLIANDPEWSAETSDDVLCHGIRTLRDQLYHKVILVPPAPLRYCYEHEEPRRVTKAGSYVHPVSENAFCTEEGLVDAKGQPVDADAPKDNLPF